LRASTKLYEITSPRALVTSAAARSGGDQHGATWSFARRLLLGSLGRLEVKIIVAVGLTLSLVLAGLVGYATWTSRRFVVRQAQESIAEQAQRCGMPYVNKRWLGGTLTNWRTIRQRIDYLKSLEERRDQGEFDLLTKKEALHLQRQLPAFSLFQQEFRGSDAYPLHNLGA